MSGSEPVAARPVMPGYGTLPATEGTGLLPWSWAEERLRASHDYWLATVQPDGRPHLMPVWGAWFDGALWFSCSPGSRKSRNLEARDVASVATDDAQQPVVVEGHAVAVVDAADVPLFAQQINAKYGEDIAEEFFFDNACFRLAPTRAFGLVESDFQGSPTRWTFEAD